MQLQVVAGTNYGIRFVAQYSCIANDDTLGQDNLVLNAIVYVPLPINGQDAEPQVSPKLSLLVAPPTRSA